MIGLHSTGFAENVLTILKESKGIYKKNGFEFLNPFTESSGDTVLMYYDLFEYCGDV